MRIAKVFFLCLILGAGAFVRASFSADASGKDFVYNDHGRRDPFVKLISPNGIILTHESDLTAVDLVLEGILADRGGTSIAIINGHVLKENDKLGAFIVKKITANEVTLSRGAELLTLKLKKED